MCETLSFMLIGTSIGTVLGLFFVAVGMAAVGLYNLLK